MGVAHDCDGTGVRLAKSPLQSNLGPKANLSTPRSVRTYSHWPVAERPETVTGSPALTIASCVQLSSGPAYTLADLFAIAWVDSGVGDGEGVGDGAGVSDGAGVGVRVRVGAAAVGDGAGVGPGAESKTTPVSERSRATNRIRTTGWLAT